MRRRLALLVLDVGDDDGSCAVSGKVARRGLTHAASSASDYSHLALELALWSCACGVCHHFVCLLLLTNCSQERLPDSGVPYIQKYGHED
ncbi:hypothetical protein CFP56_040152 [Quercus suber]|uniref:Uncharacterized protein n=1 Tax=Quercus suber TaxID=58331 RepID=A0AAW0IZ71_QUESU